MEGNVGSSMSSDTVFVKDEPLREQVTDLHGVSEAPALVFTDHEVKEELVLGPEAVQPPDAVFTSYAHVNDEVVKCLKEEAEWEDNTLYRVSESAALVELYAGHEVKDELVLGPEGLQPADIVFTLYAAQAFNTKEQPVLKDCVVQLERIDQLEHVENKSNLRNEIHRNTNLETEKETFVCDICKKNFTLKTQIMEHVMIHIHDSTLEGMRGVADNEWTQQYQRIRSKTNKSRVLVGGNVKNKEMEIAGEQTTSVLRQVYSVKDGGEILVHKHLKTNKSKEARPYKCGRCSDACNCYQKNNSVVHARKHTEEKPYKCTHCSHASAYKQHLLDHKRKHTGEKPYKCSHCSYTAIRKSYLLVHEIKHTGEKPYKCSHCSYATIHKNYLQVHDKIHTGEKLHQCSHCSYVSARKSNLLVHEKIHTGEKPYKCSNCSYASNRKNHLRQHEKRHTGEKPYKCSHCSYATAHKGALRVHERKHRHETLPM